MYHPLEEELKISLLCYLVQYLFRALREFISMALCTVASPGRRRRHSGAGYLKRLVDLPFAPAKRPKEYSVSDDHGRISVITARHDASPPPLDDPPSPPQSLRGARQNEPESSKSEDGHGRPPAASEKITAFDSTAGAEDEKCKSEKKMARRRPSMIVIPECRLSPGFDGDAPKENEEVDKVVEIEENNYSLACRKGKRHKMEDGYGVMSNINGDSKQAFFGVFDGHGGRAAVDFVSENLGKNIITAIDHDLEAKGHDYQLEEAIKSGYLTTDMEFLSKGLSSGVCAATVLVKNGELHVANVGDCRVVISRNGVADVLSSDHHAGREDERNRIENSGGYVTCRNGIWRVQDTLAVSRAIGDAYMKEWIISEPETKKISLTADCQFLIMASDGLWDKVTNQEAVDIVLKNRKSLKSCNDLVEITRGRGNRDDITVMVVDLGSFLKKSDD